MAGLEHPNIVPIHSFERLGDDLAIDMAYVAGGSLADAEESGRIRLNGVMQCAAQVLRALAACHASGIVHRDVKPSNILIADDGRALLSDFGLARLVAAHHKDAMRSSASSGFFLGTPRYAPPESWAGEEPTPAWDVYSMGVVLFEAAASRPPYDADSPLELIKQMTQAAPPALLDTADGASPELDSLVSAMMSPNAAERPQSAHEVLERLPGIPEFGPDTAGKASTVVQVTPLRKRSSYAPAGRKMERNLHCWDRCNGARRGGARAVHGQLVDGRTVSAHAGWGGQHRERCPPTGARRMDVRRRLPAVAERARGALAHETGRFGRQLAPSGRIPDLRVLPPG